MQSHLISRRSLIRSSLIGLACSAAPAISAAEKDDWTETYDVVIIGSGFAGRLPPTVLWKTASNPF